jgi:hypothetical protein
MQFQNSSFILEQSEWAKRWLSLEAPDWFTGCARLPPILRHTSLQAGGLNSNVFKDEAANLFLEVGVVADLSG